MRVTREQGDLCGFFSTLTGLTALQVGGLKVQDSELNVMRASFPYILPCLACLEICQLGIECSQD